MSKRRLKPGELMQNLLVLLITPVIFLAGCLGYNPPKYVCACLATCYESGQTYDVVNNAAIGGNSIEATKNNCLNAAKRACPNGEIKDLTCSPVTWKEWEKMREKEIKEGGRR
ncbi:MAG: hypothetical protein QXD72_02655 [Candidatus Aenigmatarchaeota archaeon]